MQLTILSPQIFFPVLEMTPAIAQPDDIFTCPSGLIIFSPRAKRAAFRPIICLLYIFL
jgi:hypothetical protein